MKTTQWFLFLVGIIMLALSLGLFFFVEKGEFFLLISSFCSGVVFRSAFDKYYSKDPD